MTTSQTITIANRMIQHINTCLEKGLDLGEMFEYVGQDFDFNNREINNLFNQVFFANFTMEQFRRG